MIESSRIVPSKEIKEKDVGSGTEFGVNDSIRQGIRSIQSEITMKHPLEARLEKWDETREELKHTIMRNSFGLGLPIQLKMEKYLVGRPRGIPVMKQHNLGLDILNGTDDTIDFEDFLGGFLKFKLDVKCPLESVNPHTAMERILRL